jgi:hypothetical protein
MALTDKCDLYAAVHEDGVNRIIQHIMLQRPSLFNYATTDIMADRTLWCSDVACTNDVTKNNNPLFTQMDPLPVFGTDSPPVTLSYCVQLTKCNIDFHGGNIPLPSQLNPPLAKQHFALQLQVCGGLGCPDVRDLEQIPITSPAQEKEGQKLPPVHIPGKIQCFCLDVYVVGHFERENRQGMAYLVGKIDGIEIVDIQPEGLENSIECYIKTAITLLLRQKAAVPLATLFYRTTLLNIVNITLTPTPTPPVPDNPAIEEDQVKVFIDMTVQ